MCASRARAQHDGAAEGARLCAGLAGLAPPLEGHGEKEGFGLAPPDAGAGDGAGQDGLGREARGLVDVGRLGARGKGAGDQRRSGPSPRCGQKEAGRSCAQRTSKI